MGSHQVMTRCSSVAASPLLPLITEGQPQQLLFTDAETLETEVAEKVLSTSLNPGSSWSATFLTEIFIHHYHRDVLVAVML